MARHTGRNSRGRPARPPAPVPRRPSSRAAPTFDAVVEAAARVLLLHGVDGLTTNRVAEIAGVSIGSLYQYFPNKEAIVSALFDRYLQRVRTIITRAIDEGTSIEDIGKRIVIGVVQASSTDRAVFGHLWVLRSAAAAHERIAAHNDELAARMAAALTRLNLATDEHARALAYVIIHTGDGLANALARSSNVDIPRVAMIYVDLYTRYFAAGER